MNETIPGQIEEGDTHRFSFAALGGLLPSEPMDPEFDLQTRREAHWSAKMACAMLDVSSALVAATIVHPGADADEKAIKATTIELMGRAHQLADAATELLGLPPKDPRLPAYKNLLRQRAVEVVSSQWRLAHGVGMDSVPVAKMADMFRVVLKDGGFDQGATALPSDDGVDEVTAKRVALMGVVPQIYEAVNCFDYFAPSREALVEAGMKKVISESDAGLDEIVSVDTRPATRTVVAQSLISKAGALYSENYKAHARQDVARLEVMEGAERARHIFIHRDAGLPRAHIDASFSALMRRMVAMVCEAVPDVDPVPPAPGAEVRAAVLGKAVGGDHEPD